MSVMRDKESFRRMYTNGRWLRIAVAVLLVNVNLVRLTGVDQQLNARS